MCSAQTAGRISGDLFFSVSVSSAHLFAYVTCCTSGCVGTPAHVWKQFFTKETTLDKVIPLERLSVFGRQSGDLQTDLACRIRF